jgi:hypothetical protein
MIGHLVSNCRQSPPDFGITSLLRETASHLQRASRHILSLLSETPLHVRKHPQ